MFLKSGPMAGRIDDYVLSSAQSAPPQVVLGGLERESVDGSMLCWLHALSKSAVPIRKKIFFMIVSLVKF